MSKVKQGFVKSLLKDLKIFKGYDGILFVGDPHAWSRGPGKRLDRDKFSEVVLDKLSQAVGIAQERNLYMVILGDLFHVDTESSIDLITKLSRVFKGLRDAPFTVEGNHERRGQNLTDDLALTLMIESNIINVGRPNELYCAINLTSGENVYIGTTPYGVEIPKSVELPKDEKDKESLIIWTTHHDLDFNDNYPGVIPVPEIKGAKMLVNGHIHKTKEPKLVGNMMAHNPGNITRLSVDCLDHTPSVWQWTKEQGNDLLPIPLKYEKNIFNLVGKQITVEKNEEKVEEEINPLIVSQFVERMKETRTSDIQKKTNDGEYIKETISALAKSLNMSDDFLGEMLDIAKDVIDS